ncbi:NTP transferase domain-containing protein [uncultured Dysosmobacter sp.]|uniref:NTP transferase domain-containing protein n=1 Tax=uncultured Dysosmobacter sp. TaxID=2591384 RepID=UPI00260C9C13|nr:NTP transferase domain-containing protein [uncultured Dysosmobacter sp.]
MNCLLIVASGKSTRFGGYPKAFVPIGDKLVVENTVHLAKPMFDEIYIAVNEETYAAYKDAITGCRMFPIVTGNGDAHSVLKCLKFLRMKEKDVTKVAVCWGDAYFTDSSPFLEAASCMENFPELVPAVVLCSQDSNPYAWFKLDGVHIKKAYFANRENRVAFGVHDQSLFILTVDLSVRYLEEYKRELGIGDDYCERSPEMKLLYFFEWLYECGKFPPAECKMIPPGSVLSFNTMEEAEEIRLRIKARKKQNSEVKCDKDCAF